MSQERCIPCEEHAKLHSGNWLGIGSDNEPCAQCEQHAKLHSAGGCGGLLFILGACAAVLTLRKRV